MFRARHYVGRRCATERVSRPSERRFGSGPGPDVALQHFEPREDGADSSERVLAWDLANVSRVSRPYLNELFDEEVKDRVTKALDAFDAYLSTPEYALLPRQLIHGDANDENILVRDSVLRHLHESSPGMMFDFGAASESPRVFRRRSTKLVSGRASWTSGILSGAVACLIWPFCWPMLYSTGGVRA